MRFQYFLQSHLDNWREEYVRYFIREGRHVPDEKLSDYEFFLECYPKPIYDEYYILDDDNKIIGHAVVRVNKESIASIGIDIEEEYEGMGFGTKLFEFVESDILKREDVKAISVLDMSPYGQSSKIARKFGYEEVSERNFIKYNSNYKGYQKKK